MCERVLGDRSLISQCAGEDEAKLDGFPDNSPDCMVNDQSVNKSWKNLLSGLYKFLNQQKRFGKKNGGFINNIKSPFENLSQEKIQNSITVTSSQRLWEQYLQLMAAQII